MPALEHFCSQKKQPSEDGLFSLHGTRQHERTESKSNAAVMWDPSEMVPQLAQRLGCSSASTASLQQEGPALLLFLLNRNLGGPANVMVWLNVPEPKFSLLPPQQIRLKISILKLLPDT